MAFGDPPQLSTKRMEAVLNSKGLNFRTDSDGDCIVPFDDVPFLFMRVGNRKEILAMVGRWERSLPLSRRDEVRALLDEWHETRRWPKGYTTVVDGELKVVGECQVDWEFGVTDKQLALTMTSALASTKQMFDFLGQKL